MLRSHKGYAVALLVVTFGLAACNAPSRRATEAPSAPQVARLGAGDELGQALFTHYVAMVRAGGVDALALRRGLQPPLRAVADSAEPWVMAVRLPVGVVQVAGDADSAEAVVLPMPSQEPSNRDLQAG